MFRSFDSSLEKTAGDRILVGVWMMAIATWTGCGAGISPEQAAAMAKVRDLGGHVDFNHGGYEVNLRGTPVENNDLAHLKQISNLKNVNLMGTHINDEGLKHLRTIKTLEVIYLQRTIVTAEGAEDLRKALPNADVQF